MNPVLIPIFLFLGLALLFFYRLAFTDLILARGDTFQYFYPYWDARDWALRSGDWPLWTNNLYMGAPLLANPQLGTLYPPNWLTIPLEAPSSIKISIILHVTWAGLGAYWLARRSLSLTPLPAIIAGTLFALGGHLGAHVEQINQLQGLSWMPWLFLLHTLAQRNPRRYLPLMGMAWAMQVLSGHAQTAFITGVGLGIYTLITMNSGIGHVLSDGMSDDEKQPIATNLTRSTLILLGAALIAVILALPQLIPAQELIALSNRGGGLTSQEATAFSLNPALIGRGFLPSYEGQVFGEYVATFGVIGLGLAIIGATSNTPRRWGWLTLVIVGLTFALGRYTPIYLLLTNLPGFDLFRVPARWLALVALAGAMLAGKGIQTLSEQDDKLPLKPLALILGIVITLAVTTLLADQAADEVDGLAIPTTIHWIGWGIALLVVSSLWIIRNAPRRMWHFIALLAVVELFLASRTLPYNDVSDPGTYDDSRFGVELMQVFQSEGVVPGRLLSISQLVFDPGDKADLDERWRAMGLSRRASDYAFTATKLKEIIAPNLPLKWDIASIDGFGGGILPTLYYTQFTSVMLPSGTPRTIDGRLREVLAQPECGGECIPPDVLLDLTNTRYLLVDKVADPVHEGIFYDPSLIFPPDAVIDNPRQFEADTLHLLVTGDDDDAVSGTPPPSPLPIAIERGVLAESRSKMKAWLVNTDNVQVTFIYADGDEAELTLLDASANVGGMQLLTFNTAEARIPQTIQLEAADTLTIHAATLVDQRTDAHVQLAPPGWRRVYSADIKIYENLDVLPRAFVVHDVRTVSDDYAGSEAALEILREVDLAQTVTLHTDNAIIQTLNDAAPSKASIRSYTPNEIVIEVDASANGWLFLSDAYYPGWQAVDQDRQMREIVRADVMFRALPVYEGMQTLTLTFAPRSFSTVVQIVGLLLWISAAGLVALGVFTAKSRSIR